MPREHTAAVKFCCALKEYLAICLHTICVPEVFAGNERSEVPEKRGDPRGGI